MVFVDNVKAYCQKNGLSVAAFERKCDVANAVIAQIERGRAKNPAVSTLFKIQQTTGIDMSYWMKEGGILEYFSTH